MFLLHWMKRFPQYAHADLYLSGESYGGHYVPNLALEIVKGNKKVPTMPAAGIEPATAASAGVSPGRGYLNLKGFFVGNAWTDAAIDNRGECVREQQTMCVGGGSCWVLPEGQDELAVAYDLQRGVLL
jgi:serine carboxypeptidase-like clade 2